MNKELLVRRITISAEHILEETAVPEKEAFQQLDLFTDYAALEKKQKEKKAEEGRERRLQEAVLEIKRRFGKNAVIRGMNLLEGATAIDRNRQIGGHRA